MIKPIFFFFSSSSNRFNTNATVNTVKKHIYENRKGCEYLKKHVYRYVFLCMGLVFKKKKKRVVCHWLPETLLRASGSCMLTPPGITAPLLGLSRTQWPVRSYRKISRQTETREPVVMKHLPTLNPLGSCVGVEMLKHLTFWVYLFRGYLENKCE